MRNYRYQSRVSLLSSDIQSEIKFTWSDLDLCVNKISFRKAKIIHYLSMLYSLSVILGTVYIFFF